MILWPSVFSWKIFQLSATVLILFYFPFFCSPLFFFLVCVHTHGVMTLFHKWQMIILILLGIKTGKDDANIAIVEEGKDWLHEGNVARIQTR